RYPDALSLSTPFCKIFLTNLSSCPKIRIKQGVAGRRREAPRAVYFVIWRNMLDISGKLSYISLQNELKKIFIC
ncbi:hypothetical protein, partial [uncultured Desulfovibrio sp.]|uniref:hypothetical protein n=1 Tax=uncultured Desulfovibrio sp. TaxID=167968 RepID=UPI0025975477